MTLGQEQDEKEDQSTMDIPEEIKRRKDRLTKIDSAKKAIEQRRKETYQKEKAEFDKSKRLAKRRKYKQARRHGEEHQKSLR